MAIVTNERLEYEMSAIDVTYPDIGKVTYRGSYPLIVSNQWMPPKTLGKGDIITMDGKDYRVLKLNGTIAEVLAMYDAKNPIVFDTNSSYNNTYAGKNIDTYCNTEFYTALSEAMKNAIVDKTFTQDSWDLTPFNAPIESHYTGTSAYIEYYYLTLVNATFGTSITRHCYCLSVQDVLDYLECTTSMGTSDTTLTDTNVWTMFWNRTTSPDNTYLWLRSAHDFSGDNTQAFVVGGNYGNLSESGYVIMNGAARPAFQIDLSKVEYTIK